MAIPFAHASARYRRCWLDDTTPAYLTLTAGDGTLTRVYADADGYLTPPPGDWVSLEGPTTAPQRALERRGLWWHWCALGRRDGLTRPVVCGRQLTHTGALRAYGRAARVLHRL